MKLPSLLLLLAYLIIAPTHGQVPPLINYQGRVAVNGTNFDGTGHFKFALVNTVGSQTFWSNDGTSTAGSEPAGSVPLTVVNGLHSVLLGDSSLANMTGIPTAAFSNPDVRLRVWFNDGTNGSQLLTPDQRLAPNAYLADGAVQPSALAANAVTSSKLAPGAVNGTHVAAGSLDFSRLNVTAAPGPGQVLSFDGQGLVWTTPSGGGSGPWLLNGTSAYYNGGRVGIGTTNPASKLTVLASGTGFEHTDGVVRLSTFITGNAGWFGTLSNSPLYFFTNGGQAMMTLDISGKVGFGTTTPDHQLSIKSFAGGPGWTSSGWGGAISLDNAAAIGWQPNATGKSFGMGHTNGNFLMFRTDSAPGLTGSQAIYDFAINDGGLVGIGTTDPKSKLDVRTNAFEYGFSHTTAAGLRRLSSYVDTGGFWLGTNSSDPLFFYTANSQPVVTIATNGRVGIGTTAPQTKLEVDTTTGNYGVTHSDGNIKVATYVGGSSSGVSGGWMGTSSNHPFFLYVNGGQPALTVNTDNSTTVKVLTITGGADVAEPFPIEEELLEKGSVVVIDEKHPGKLKRSTHSYDKRVAGIVSGANGINPGIALHQEGSLEGDQNVALSGRVYVEADASASPIEPGDLLTTSDVPGHAMKVTDQGRAQGAVLGKAMSPLKQGTGLVLVLVSLQ